MHERKLVRWMKVLLSELGLNAYNWRYIEVKPAIDGQPRKLIVIHKHSTKTKEIPLRA